MGGDRGPQEVVRGVMDVARHEQRHRFVLVGDSAVIEPELAAARPRPQNVAVMSATQVIEMTDQPTVAFRQKPDASIVVAARMVKDKKADALVSIGNTG